MEEMEAFSRKKSYLVRWKQLKLDCVAVIRDTREKQTLVAGYYFELQHFKVSVST